ncbi:MAG: aminopeptidase [Pseudomonadota bacterium]
MRRVWHLMLILAVLSAFSGCRALGYYGQAVTGQLGLLMQRQPVDEVLAGDGVSPGVRGALQQASAVREFAGELLGLEAAGSYRHYVSLDRPYVVWNVFAAPSDSLALREWCFPVAGCVGYRGYFSKAAAHREAERLGGLGYDVYVGGVTAYSTLGWFDDPLTTPMLQRPDWALAALLFHEMAHQRVYVPGDTVFNESFATFIEQAGLRRWHEVGPGDARALEEWRGGQRRQTAFVELVGRHAAHLEQLYANEGDARQVAAARERIRQQLRDEYAALRTCWGVDAYGDWFAGPLNNAQLATVAAYNQWVPAFALLMEQSSGDWAVFLDAVETLAGLEPAERDSRMIGLAGEAEKSSGVTPVPATRCDPASS